jgi:hypothetical protein
MKSDDELLAESAEAQKFRESISALDDRTYSIAASSGFGMAADIERLKAKVEYFGEYIVFLLGRIEELEAKATQGQRPPE